MTLTDTGTAPGAESRGPDPVPFLDLPLQNDAVREEARAAFDEVAASGAFVLGPQVAAFEAEYAAYCEVDHCIGVANGTDALELALAGAGVGPGDEVVVPANTFVATAEAVLRVGADLALADCTGDFLVDPASVADVATSRTRAVIGVDLYGQVAPFEALREAVGPDVVLLEDGAQSQGARRHDRAAGSFGAASATSFYPGKNLGAFGDAGAVTTADPEVAERVRALRNHGGTRKYEHVLVGRNSRLDTVQAAVLSAKLRRLAAWNAARVEAAGRYAVLLDQAGLPGVERPAVAAGNDAVWHLYVVQVPDRARVLAGLAEHGIGAGIHYPTPVHRLPAFAGLDLDHGHLPVAEATSERIVSLPMFPGLTGRQQERVVEVLEHLVRSAP